MGGGGRGALQNTRQHFIYLFIYFFIEVVKIDVTLNCFSLHLQFGAVSISSSVELTLVRKPWQPTSAPPLLTEVPPVLS